jgi:hypothetical protein
MPIISKRYFIFSQVPKSHLDSFIQAMKSNSKIGRVPRYDNVWFISEGTEYAKSLVGANPVGNPNGIDPSVLWIGSCEIKDSVEVLQYISDVHPWEFPMIYGCTFDFPVPTKEEMEKKHKQEDNMIDD